MEALEMFFPKCSQNAMQKDDAFVPSYSKDSAWLVSDLQESEVGLMEVWA